MFLLRRAAARTVLLQPARHLSSLRSSTTRISPLQTSKPSVCRTFHQSRISRAEEDERKPAEASPVAEEAVAEELKDEAIDQADIAASATEAAQEAEEAADHAESAVEAAEASEAAEDAVEMAEDAAQTAEVVAEEVIDSPGAGRESGQVAAAAAESAAFAAGVAGTAAVNAQIPPASRQPAQRPDFPPRDAPIASSFREVQPSRILYVGNLFFEVTTKQLESEFSRFGEITNSRIVSDARGLSKGFGYIEFATQEAADRAVREADQKVLEGRRMAVQFHVRRERPANRFGGAAAASPNRGNNPPSKTLFIGNMSYQMSDTDLNDMFRNIRDVLDVRVAIDRRTGQPRGFAHADFIDVAAAQRAKEVLERKEVYGRQLRIDFSVSHANGRPEGSA